MEREKGSCCQMYEEVKGEIELRIPRWRVWREEEISVVMVEEVESEESGKMEKKTVSSGIRELPEKMEDDGPVSDESGCVAMIAGGNEAWLCLLAVTGEPLKVFLTRNS